MILATTALGGAIGKLIREDPKKNGRHDWTRTSDLYRVKVAL